MSDSIRILSKRQSTLPGHNEQECAYQEYGVLKLVPKDVGFQKHIFHLHNSKLKKTKQNPKLTWEQPIKCSTWTSPCVKIHFESCTVALQYKDMFVQYKGLQATNATKPTVQYEAGSLILWCYFFASDVSGTLKKINDIMNSAKKTEYFCPKTFNLKRTSKLHPH